MVVRMKTRLGLAWCLALRGCGLAWCLALLGCSAHFTPTPGEPARGVRAGRAPEPFHEEQACLAWRSAVDFDREASSHVSFPEREPTVSCFVEVEHGERGARAVAVPDGCGYPGPGVATHLGERAALYERVAGGDDFVLPLELACPLPPEYTTLQPALYSLDLILPVINLQQDGDWAPIVARSDGSPLFWGHALRGLVWFEILFGWITSLMLAAVVANLVRKD